MIVPNFRVIIYPSLDQADWGGSSNSTNFPPAGSWPIGAKIELTCNPSAATGIHGMVRSMTWKHSRQNPVDPATFDVVPFPGEADWFELIHSNDYIQIWDNDILEWDGLVEFCGYRRNLGGRTYSIRAKCFGIVFAEYANLVYDRAIAGVAIDKNSQRSRFITTLKDKLGQLDNSKISDTVFWYALWNVYFDAFMEIAGVFNQSNGSMPIEYTLSDGRTLSQVFPRGGSEFFKVGPSPAFDIPLWVNAFNVGQSNVTLHQMAKEFVQEPFNEYMMFRCRDDIKIPLGGGQYVSENGFRAIIRKSLFDPDVFSGIEPTIVLPKGLTGDVQMQKTTAEIHTAYLASTSMTLLGSGMAVTAGGVVTDIPRVKRYGMKFLEIPIKSSIRGQNPTNQSLREQEQEGGNLLKKMFCRNDEMYSGTMTIPYMPMRPATLMQWDEPFRSGSKTIKSLVDEVSVSYESIEKPVTTTVQFIRGEVVK